MVVINNSRRYFVKEHGCGLGNITYKSIRGDAILRDSNKNIGKLLYLGWKKVFGFIKPRAITFVKDTLKDIKRKVGDIFVDKSTKLIHGVFNKPKELKQTSKEIIKEIANESKEKIIPVINNNINNTTQKSYFDINPGKGVKRRPVSEQSRQLLKIISKINGVDY